MTIQPTSNVPPAAARAPARRRAAIWAASWLYGACVVAAVAISVLSASCGDKGAAAGPPCDPKSKPKCDGKKIVACGTDGHQVSKDCSTDGLTCVKNAKGEPSCGKICPLYMDKLGACDGKNVQACDGQVLIETDCTKQNVNYTCGYLVEGYPQCTKNYCIEAQEMGLYHSPAGPNAEGACTADVMGSSPGDVGKVIYHRCSGTVYQETLDCSLAGAQYTCARDGESVAQCTEKNPGVDAFGKCGTDAKDGVPTAEHLDGMQYFKLRCEPPTECAEKVDRFGVGCRGCGDALPEGACSHSKTSRATYCDANGERVFESCIARGGECGFNDKTCRYECINTKDGRTCADDGLMPGQAKCIPEPVTKLPQIVVCTAEGKREVVECPAAGDGSVQCKELAPGEPVIIEDGGVGPVMGDLLLKDGTPAGASPTLGCVTTMPCGAMGARCTDRGVLLKCDGQVVPSWIDCVEAGATCVDGDDAHCACAGELPPWASRCIYGQQLKCMGGRIERVPCTCTPPP